MLSANVIGQSQKIDILYGGNFKKDEAQFPGASIFTKDVNGQVQFRHQGADMWCDQAFLYADENRIYAEAGPQFGLLYKSWVQFDSDVDGTETQIRIENKDVLNIFTS